MATIVPVDLSTLAPYEDPRGHLVQPGCYGVSHGGGLLVAMVRRCTESWAGHAFIYVGNGLIVEGTVPVARVSEASHHPDAIWNLNEPLTDDQRIKIIAKAYELVGTRYDYFAYLGFTWETLLLRKGEHIQAAYKGDRRRVCSALVADAYEAAGIPIDQDFKYPNLVSPADLYNRIARLSQ